MNSSPIKADDLVKAKSQKKIRAMFDDIAPSYDFLNHVLSGGIDVFWRWQTVRRIQAHLELNTSSKILDVATGTGDLAVMLSGIKNSEVIGIDLSEEMLKRARVKKPNINFLLGEAESLPFQDGAFDAVTAGFGARNFENLEQGLGEFYRVLKPNGIAAVLEPMIPRKQAVRKLYQWYFKHMLPKIARLFSKSDFAYDYLPRSVESFPQGEAFLAILRKVGFRETSYFTMTLETAIVYIAKK